MTIKSFITLRAASYQEHKVFNVEFAHNRKLRNVVKAKTNTRWNSEIIYDPDPNSHCIKSTAGKINNSKRVYFNILRYSYVVHLLNQGVDNPFIQQRIGHEILRTTQKYTLFQN